MKHILRRPLLPCVLIALMIFSVCFITLFRQSIADNRETVEEMYESVEVKFRVLPDAFSNGVLSLRSKTAEKLLEIEGVMDCSYYLECHYSMREPIQWANCASIYATNDFSFLSDELGVSITYGDGWDERAVLNGAENDQIPCLVEENMAYAMGIKIGDTLTIAPNADVDEDSPYMQSLTVVAAGTFADGKGNAGIYGLIVSDAVFMNNEGFLFAGSGTRSYYLYRGFSLRLYPSYNRDFMRIRDEIESVLKMDGNFILYSNVRVLERVVRPIEQKLRIQQMLVTPLSLFLCISTVVMALFLCNSFSGEIFLRLLFGERRLTVWLRMMWSLFLVLFLAGSAATLAVWLISGTQWIGWSLRYSLLTMGVCIVASAIMVAIFAGRNLVAFYQSREE